MVIQATSAALAPLQSRFSPLRLYIQYGFKLCAYRRSKEHEEPQHHGTFESDSAGKQRKGATLLSQAYKRVSLGYILLYAFLALFRFLVLVEVSWSNRHQ